MGINEPWLVLGDFNAILIGEDKMGPPLTNHDTQDFEDLVSQANLLVIGGLSVHFN